MVLENVLPEKTEERIVKFLVKNQIPDFWEGYKFLIDKTKISEIQSFSVCLRHFKSEGMLDNSIYENMVYNTPVRGMMSFAVHVYGDYNGGPPSNTISSTGEVVGYLTITYRLRLRPQFDKIVEILKKSSSFHHTQRLLSTDEENKKSKSVQLKVTDPTLHIIFKNLFQS